MKYIGIIHDIDNNPIPLYWSAGDILADIGGDIIFCNLFCAFEDAQETAAHFWRGDHWKYTPGN